MACPYTHGPPLNTDIAGLGVRVGLYAQALLGEFFQLPAQNIIPESSI
jgi:hypothetical protein